MMLAVQIVVGEFILQGDDLCVRWNVRQKSLTGGRTQKWAIAPTVSGLARAFARSKAGVGIPCKAGFNPNSSLFRHPRLNPSRKRKNKK